MVAYWDLMMQGSYAKSWNLEMMVDAFFPRASRAGRSFYCKNKTPKKNFHDHEELSPDYNVFFVWAAQRET